MTAVDVTLSAKEIKCLSFNWKKMNAQITELKKVIKRWLIDIDKTEE